ncbi:MAG: hypothetical protein ACXW1W_17270 [Methylococcaceae bacterium]
MTNLNGRYSIRIHLDDLDQLMNAARDRQRFQSLTMASNKLSVHGSLKD